MFAEGNIKGQNCPRGSLGKKLDLKGCNFKPIRGLDASTIKSLLERLTKQELSIPEMTKEFRKMKTLRDLQKAFVVGTGVKTWEEAEMKFPDYTNAEALDQFIEENPKKAITSNRFKAFCRGALHSLEANAVVVVSPVEGSFQHERATAFELPNLTISYSSINTLCSHTKTPFKGLTLTILHMQHIKTNEGEVSLALLMFSQ